MARAQRRERSDPKARDKHSYVYIIIPRLMTGPGLAMWAWRTNGSGTLRPVSNHRRGTKTSHCVSGHGKKRSATDLQKHGLPPFARRQKHDPRHTGPAPPSPSPSHPQPSIGLSPKWPRKPRHPTRKQRETATPPHHGGARNARLDKCHDGQFPNIARWTVDAG